MGFKLGTACTPNLAFIDPRHGGHGSDFVFIKCDDERETFWKMEGVGLYLFSVIQIKTLSK